MPIDVRADGGSCSGGDAPRRVMSIQQPRQTSVYLQGIDNAEIIDTVHARRAPMIPVSTSVRP